MQKSGYILGCLGAKIALTSTVKPWSVLKETLAVIEMQAHPNNAEIDEILADIPKGDRNRNPTASQYSILCPSFGLTNWTKTLCFAKKWCDIRPHNSYRTINNLSVHWSNHFKSLNNTKKIPHLVLKMADNHLNILYSHHILKHGGNYHPYFYYGEKSEV